VLAVVLAVASACAEKSESRGVADRFMELYYGRSRVAEAVELCAGAAKTRLQGELDALRGMPAAASAEQPRVTFRLDSVGAATATQATYVYRVDARSSDVGPLVATLVLTGDGGRWLVTTLQEQPGGP
jgi:hypothetical protein